MAFAGVYDVDSSDNHLNFPEGLTADGRILIDKARMECQSHRLTVEDPVTVEFSRYASFCALYFGFRSYDYAEIHTIRWCSTFWDRMLNYRLRSSRHDTSFIYDGAQWYLQCVEGNIRFIFFHWQAVRPVCLLNRRMLLVNRQKPSGNSWRKNFKDDMTREESVKLTVKSLLEVVQTGAKNIEISVMDSTGKVTVR